MRKYLIPTLFLLAACNPYKKVALDKFRNAKERALLAKAANEEFPNTIDTIPHVTVEYDSSEVQRLNDEYAKLVDQYIEHLEGDSSQFANREPYTNSDSSRKREQDEFVNRIKSLKPAVITKTVTKEVKIRDGVWAEMKQGEINTCREELRLMTFQKDEFKTKNGNKTKIIMYMGIAWIILLAIIIWKPTIPKLF